MRHDFRNEITAIFAGHDHRLTVLERWQQRIIGALAVLTFALAVLVAPAVLKWLH